MERKKLDYKWVVAAVSFLAVLTALGFCSSSKSLYLDAITNALGISRSAFSINDSCRFITTSIVNLFFGTLFARFGAKKLMCAGFVSLIISMFLYSIGENVFVFYAGGVFLGIGMAWTTTTMVGVVIGNWFKENRGTVMGAVLASNGLGAALAIQIVSPMIEAHAFGYRDAYRLIMVILLVVGVLVAIFMKDKPKEDNGTPVSAQKKAKRGQSWAGIEFSAAAKKAYFYAALVCIFITGLLLQGITGISKALMKDTGLDAGYIATVLSMHSIALTVFKFAVGFVYDKKGLRVTSNMCFITAIIVMFMLANVTNSPTGKVLAMIYGIFSSLALPLETIMLPIYTADLFGEKSYAKILGIISSVNTAGYAVGAPLMNLCYDLLGNYNVAIYIGCGLMAVATIVMQFVISTAHKQRKKIEEEIVA